MGAYSRFITGEGFVVFVPYIGYLVLGCSRTGKPGFGIKGDLAGIGLGNGEGSRIGNMYRVAAIAGIAGIARIKEL